MCLSSNFCHDVYSDNDQNAAVLIYRLSFITIATDHCDIPTALASFTLLHGIRAVKTTLVAKLLKKLIRNRSSSSNAYPLWMLVTIRHFCSLEKVPHSCEVSEPRCSGFPLPSSFCAVEGSFYAVRPPL